MALSVSPNIAGLNHTLQQLITQLALNMQDEKSQEKYPKHKNLIVNTIHTTIQNTA